MTTVAEVCTFLEQFAPLSLAESWDNVGLLVGREHGEVKRIMTCLTVTPESVAEAIDEAANLVVAHHPLPFQPLKSVTDRTVAGQMLLDLISNGIAVYSPHTCFDSAPQGINQQWAERLGLRSIRPIEPCESDSQMGGGRIGQLAPSQTLGELAHSVRATFDLVGMHLVGNPDKPISTVAVACGAAGVYLSPAIAAGADALVTGETNFHTCLEAKAKDAGLILVGHYASERFAVETLAEVLDQNFAVCDAWASKRECDPVGWL